MRLQRLGLLVILALRATGLAAQSADVPGSTTGEAENQRPGLIRLGSLYLTPYIHVGSLGIDTNVFYSETDRQTDFTASGGPGLEIVLPFGRKSRLRVDGGLDYLYFARTESQRSLNGYGSAELHLRGVKTRLTIQERYEDTFARPNYEVNARVEYVREATLALLRRDLGERMRVVLLGSRLHETTQNYDYLGTDLGTTLTDDRYVAGGELQLGLSIKTRLVAGGEQTWYGYPNVHARDGSSTLGYGGFRTDDSALVAGAAIVGMRWFRLDSGAKRNSVYVNVSPRLALSPKTKLGGLYTRDIDYSTLLLVGPTPTNLNETAEVFLEKFLTRSIYLRLYARQYRLNSDGDVVVVLPDDTLVIEKRKDRVREAGAEIGYQFRPQVRAGFKVYYTDRASNIETFGVEGLLAGVTVQYNPPQPTFR